MPISSMYSRYNVTYSPEWGYSATPKDPSAPQVPICWGREFVDKVRQTAARQAAEEAEAAKNAPPRPRLTDGEIKELAEKYNPGSMTRDQYNSFLEELVGKGVLSAREIGYLGYKGMVYLDLSSPKPLKVTPVQIDLSDPLARKWMYGGYSMCGGLFRFDGTPNDEMDLLLSAKLYDLFTPSEKKDAYPYYGALYEVVRRMDSVR